MITMNHIRELPRVTRLANANDFSTASDEVVRPPKHIRRSCHGYVKLNEIAALLREAGLTIVDSGAVGFRDLRLFARALQVSLRREHHDGKISNMKPRGRSLVHRLILLAAVGLFVAAHGAILYYVSSHATVSIAAVAVILLVVKHLGILGPLFAWFRRRRPPCVQ
jgi:hypothetical protein